MDHLLNIDILVIKKAFMKWKNTGVAKRILSSLSSKPPCPGMRCPVYPIRYFR
jgi:hypothetical protein